MASRSGRRQGGGFSPRGSRRNQPRGLLNVRLLISTTTSACCSMPLGLWPFVTERAAGGQEWEGACGAAGGEGWGAEPPPQTRDRMFRAQGFGWCPRLSSLRLSAQSPTPDTSQLCPRLPLPRPLSWCGPLTLPVRPPLCPIVRSVHVSYVPMWLPSPWGPPHRRPAHRKLHGQPRFQLRAPSARGHPSSLLCTPAPAPADPRCHST